MVGGTGLVSAQCGAATVSNTDTIAWTTAAAGNESFTIDMSNGPIAPGATDEAGNFDEPEFNISLGTGTNTFTITGCDATCDTGSYAQCGTTNCGFSSNDGLVWGISGFNLNGLGETDTNDDLDNITTNPYTATTNFVLNGGDGNDTLSLAGTSITGIGSSVVGTTVIKTTNTINGNAGDDTLYGSITPAVDTINGGAGDDLIQARSGNDTNLDGGADDGVIGDTLDCSSAGAVAATVNLTTTSHTCDGTDTTTNGTGTDVGSSFENIIGTSAADSLTGDADDNRITASGGADLAVSPGADELYGDTAVCSTTVVVDVNLTRAANTNQVCDGNDRWVLGTGNDLGSSFENVISGSAVDLLVGDADDNRFTPGAGADINIAGGLDIFGDILDCSTVGATTVTWSLAVNTGQACDGTDSVANAAATGSDIGSSIEGVVGGTGADTLTGDADDNEFSGGLGNDSITGGADQAFGDTLDCSSSTVAVVVDLNNTTGTCEGTDTIATGTGNDVGSSIENVIGGPLADTLTGGNDDNIFTGGAGADTYSPGGDQVLGDTLDCSTSGNVAVSVDLTTTSGTCEGADTWINGTGNDLGSAFENVVGGTAADTLTGDADDNRFQPGGGADLSLTGGNDLTYGDTLDCSTAVLTAATVNLTGTAQTCDGADTTTNGSGTDVGSSFENVIGTQAADSITGDGDDNRVTPWLGTDATLVGGNDLTYGDTIDCSTAGNTAANVTLAATAGETCDGTDTIAAGSGTDTGNSFENVIGTNAADTIVGDVDDNRIQPGAAADLLLDGGNDGGTYGDTLDCSTAGATAVVVNLTTTSATCDGADTTVVGAGTDTGNSFENVIGGRGADTLTGGVDDNTFTGGAGNDTLAGAGDGVVGDTLDCSTAEATVVTVDLTTTSVTCDGTDTLTNGTGTDLGSSFENIIGGRGADTLTGGVDDNRFAGGAGNDSLDGGGDWLIGDTLDCTTAGNVAVVVDLSTTSVTCHGTDTLALGSGNDLGNSFENIIGGTGADTLTGGSDDNRIAGGTGNDTLSGGGDWVSGDTLDCSTTTTGATVNLTTTSVTCDGTDTLVNGTGTDVGSSFENIIGTSAADSLTGDSDDNKFTPGAANDLLLAPGADGGVVGDTLDCSSVGATAVSVNLATNLVTACHGVDTIAAVEAATNSQFENVIGGTGADTLTGDVDDNTLTGGGGADTLDASTDGTPGDTLDCSTAYSTVVTANLTTTSATCDGTDSMVAESAGNSSFENVIGGISADTLTGDPDTNILTGGQGGDTLAGGTSVDTASYWTGLQAVIADLDPLDVPTPGSNTNDAAGDTYSAMENFTGTPGDDTLMGSSGSNVLNGGEGDDTLTGLAGGDTFLGGGNGTTGDTADYSASPSGINLDLNAGSAGPLGSHASADVYGLGTHGIENIIGTGFDDQLTGDSSNNTITSGAGDDEILAAGGTDTIAAGAGDDDLSGGAAVDSLDGGTGYDALAGDAGGDTLTDNDSDVDTLNYSNSPSAVTVNISANTASGGDAASDVITGTSLFHNIVGSFTAGAGDTLTGNTLSNTLIGGNGADTMNGGDADDNLVGGPGADILNGGLGSDVISAGNDSAADTIRGGDGGGDSGASDEVSYARCGSGVTVDLSIAVAQNTGCGLDVITGMEQVRGSAFADTLTGDGTGNFIAGGAGADAIDGGGGDDLINAGRGADGTVSVPINGGAGQDTIFGGLGDDFLSGGADDDYVDGEGGSDTCVGEQKLNCEA
ncbi:MAG: hypothetical protein QOG04_91 [Actinomycetota bacterium]|jgi:Ca2+-binding RTX toxin-like protein|nr:hypothetical protein [Actinomycetota bacterium]